MINSAEDFVRLRNSLDPALYERRRQGRGTLDVWRDIIERFPEMRLWVAYNKTVPLEVLEVLARDRDPRVRLMVAAKNKLTADILETLAIDPDDAVRMRVARHKHTSREILEKLRNDPWEDVRASFPPVCKLNVIFERNQQSSLDVKDRRCTPGFLLARRRTGLPLRRTRPTAESSPSASRLRCPCPIATSQVRLM